MLSENPSLIKLKVPNLGKDALHGPIGECVQKLAPTVEAHPSAILLPLLVGMGNIFGRAPYFHVNRSIHHTNLFGLVILELVDPEWYRHCVKRSVTASGPGLWNCFRDPKGTDKGVTDKRVEVEEQEFGRVLGLMNNSDTSIGPVYREIWDSPSFKNHGTRSNSFDVTNPHGSVIGHITPEEFSILLAEIERYSGSINRFLLFYNRSVRSLADPPTAQAKDYQGIIHNHKKAVRIVRARGGGAETFRMSRSQEGTAFWLSIYTGVKFPKERPDIASVLAKGVAYLLRLSMIYALCDHTSVIQEVHIRAALAVWLYSVQTARFLFGPELLTDKAQKLRAHLQMTGELTLVEINDDVFQKNLRSKQVQEVLKELANAGFIEISQYRTEGAKRDTTVIRKIQ